MNNIRIDRRRGRLTPILRETTRWEQADLANAENRADEIVPHEGMNKLSSIIFIMLLFLLSHSITSAQWVRTNLTRGGIVYGLGVMDSDLFAGRLY